MKNVPVFSFLGFNLLHCEYNRKGSDSINYFSIKLNNYNYNEIKNIYTIGIIIALNYGKNNNSIFEFTSAYRINDLNWYNKIDKKILNNNFFAIVFPYIRKMISDITDDSRGNLVMPIIDLTGIDLNRGATFTLNKLL